MGGTCRDSGWGLIEEPAPSQAFVDHVIQLKIPPRRRHRQKDGLMDEWLEGRAASLMEALSAEALMRHARATLEADAVKRSRLEVVGQQEKALAATRLEVCNCSVAVALGTRHGPLV